MPSKIPKAKKEDWNDLFKSGEGKLRRKSEPIIKIKVGKTLWLTSGFLQEAKDEIEENEYVFLYYSAKQNAIVMQFSQNRLQKIKGDELKAFKLTTLGGGSNLTISAKRFFARNHLAIDTLDGDYKPELMNFPDLGNCWTIYLK